MRLRALTMLLAMFANGCVSPYVETSELPSFTTDTTEPGSEVRRGNASVDLVAGDVDLKKSLPEVELIDSSWNSFHFHPDGHVRIISVVPSIDTRVCEQQTHLLAETETVNPKVERVTISRDLPTAQKRFAMEAGLSNVTFMSDYRAGSFGKAAGLMMADSGLLARAVLVVDQKGAVRHLQIVPDLARLPDLARAIEVANSLVRDAP
jgi:thiol peroxidase